MQLEINNLTGARINKSYFQKLVRKIFRKLSIKNFKISLALVGEKRIKELNKKYRQQNKATDVLSFPYSKNSGEIIICYPQAVRQKKDTIRNELTLLLIHAILHLLGHKDDTEDDRQKMRAREQKIITQLKII